MCRIVPLRGKPRESPAALCHGRSEFGALREIAHLVGVTSQVEKLRFAAPIFDQRAWVL